MVKQIVLGIIAAIVLVVGLNSFTITAAGTTDVQTILGKVQPVPLREGFHFINPISHLDTMDTRNLVYEVSALNIPTQDRFNSTANVTVKYRIDEAKTPWIKQNYGTVEEFIHKTMRQSLRSIIRDEGRKVSDSRGLAQSDIVSAMQDNSFKRLQDAMEGTGVTVQELLIQDIEFDKRIAKQILDTQERIQREEAENSQLRIDITQAQQKKAQAKGDADKQIELAKASAFEVESSAKAKATAVREAADASRYSLEQQAAGNKALQASLTSEILKLKELEVRQVEAGKGWQGDVPSSVTIFGEGSQQPLFLKQMQ